MSEPTAQDPHDAARDRLTDRVLAEALGGEQPPDLADAILERSADAQSAPVSQGARMMRNRRAWVAVLTTAASLAIGTVLWPGQAAVESDIARNEKIESEWSGGASSIRGEPTPKTLEEAEAIVEGLKNRSSLAEEQLLRESLESQDGLSAGLGGDRQEVMPEMPLVVPDKETLKRSTGSRAKYKRVDTSQEGAPLAALNALNVKPGQIIDGSELRDSERRLGAAAIFNTNPAQGSVPKITYEVSEETKRRLAERQRQRLGRVPPGQADSQIERAGQSPPFPYYSTKDVEDAARARSKVRESGQLAQSSSSRAGGNGEPSAGVTLRPPGAQRAKSRWQSFSAIEPTSIESLESLRSDDSKRVASLERDGALTEIRQPKLGDIQTREYPRHNQFGFYNPEGRRWPSSAEPPSADRYTAIQENAFVTPKGGDALSTFSIDVDTASYANVRQYLMQSRRLPPPSAVRVEELTNYFDYGYQPPVAGSEDPFTASMEVQACPWKPNHQLVRIGIKGREVAVEKRPLSNLVFLVDVSGSMNQPNKLPLVVSGLKALTDRLGENDRVAIVVYAGSEGVVLPSTSGEKRDEIRSALGRLQAGGSTAGGAGLKLAYEIAEQNQISGGVNRVVLCTDGDFNVGLTGTEELTKLVETRAKETGVFLTVLGFGRGNLNDAMLESISGRGDGHYAYLDSEKEARRVLSRDLSGTLVTIAKDVKLQVEFNPAKVASYRLVGYENRVMAAKDFNDDTKDAGEIGAGHTVTALYEVVPVGAEPKDPPVDNLKYQPTGEPRPSGSDQPSQTADDGPATQPAESTADSQEPAADSNELLTLKIRYKQPTGGASKKLEFPLEAVELGAERRSRLVSDDFRWAAAVAEFGLLLRGSQHAGDASFDSVLELARTAIGDDPQGYRAELLDLVRRAKELRGE